MERFERLTRRLEAIHEIAFLSFLGWSIWRAATRRTPVRDLGFATVVYVVLILSPAMMQRYNRLRVYAAMRHRLRTTTLSAGCGQRLDTLSFRYYYDSNSVNLPEICYPEESLDAYPR